MPTHEPTHEPTRGPDDARHLLGVPVRNPTSREAVHDWIRRRVAQDPAMRAAQHRNDDRQEDE